MKREDIIQSLMARNIVIFQETSSINVDCFRYLVLAGNFLNFRLCEIQLCAQFLLGEHGPLITSGTMTLRASGIGLQAAVENLNAL